jgi:hypothetical protein
MRNENGENTNADEICKESKILDQRWGACEDMVKHIAVWWVACFVFKGL